MKFEYYVDNVVMKLASDAGASSGRLAELMSSRQFVDFLHGTIGISSEMGELLDAYRKADAKPGPMSDEHRREVLGELGDILWFTGLASRALGASVEVGQGVDSGSRKWSGDAELDMVVCSGELLSIAKARIFYGREIAPGLAISMLSRIVDGVRSLARKERWTLEDVMRANIAKLSKRYPELEFSDDSANNRDTDAEFVAME